MIKCIKYNKLQGSKKVIKPIVNFKCKLLIVGGGPDSKSLASEQENHMIWIT